MGDQPRNTRGGAFAHEPTKKMTRRRTSRGSMLRRDNECSLFSARENIIFCRITEICGGALAFGSAALVRKKFDDIFEGRGKYQSLTVLANITLCRQRTSESLSTLEAQGKKSTQTNSPQYEECRPYEEHIKNNKKEHYQQPEGLSEARKTVQEIEGSSKELQSCLTRTSQSSGRTGDDTNRNDKCSKTRLQKLAARTSSRVKKYGELAVEAKAPTYLSLNDVSANNYYRHIPEQRSEYEKLQTRSRTLGVKNTRVDFLGELDDSNWDADGHLAGLRCVIQYSKLVNKDACVENMERKVAFQDSRDDALASKITTQGHAGQASSETSGKAGIVEVYETSLNDSRRGTPIRKNYPEVVKDEANQLKEWQKELSLGELSPPSPRHLANVPDFVASFLSCATYTEEVALVNRDNITPRAVGLNCIYKVDITYERPRYGHMAQTACIDMKGRVNKLTVFCLS
ncbi:hypothetical protein OG21DRAFT_1522965 [Imleria badia]|nr:hypothetical protein OG21DRAFT_1522965 [Imleria badia]